MHEIRIVQVVNTLAHSDGGPARNSFELNLALNELPGTAAALVWVRGHLEDSVIDAHMRAGGRLPSNAPRALGLRSVKARTISIARLLRTIRSADALVIHGYFLAWVPALAAISRMVGTRVFLMPHGALTPHELGHSSRKKRAFQMLVETAVGHENIIFVTGSPGERDQIAALGRATNVFWAGVGARGPADPPTPRRLEIPPRVLTMSRLAPKKRIDLAIGAVARLRDRGRTIELHVAGDGPAAIREELRILALRLEVEDRIHFHGLVTGPDKERLLTSSDLFLLPSEDENFGIAVAEASAHGLVVIASDRVAAAAALTPAVAWRTSDLNADSVADAIEAAIDAHTPEVRLMASNEAQQCFSWQAVADRWRQIIVQHSMIRGLEPPT